MELSSIDAIYYQYEPNVYIFCDKYYEYLSTNSDDLMT